MPIKSLSPTPAPGHFVQVCASCGAEHTISIDRAGQKARTGPVSLRVGDTLAVRIDSAPPVPIAFEPGDFPDFARITAAQLAAKVRAVLPGVLATDDRGGLLIESATRGAGSTVEVVGGTAAAALGLMPTGLDPIHGRPILGLSLGAGQVVDHNVIVLRRCADCGANECLLRTFDAAEPHLDGSHFAEHRRVVNTLAEHCKANGCSHPEVAAVHAAELVAPPDLHPAFPAQRVDLPPSGRPVSSTARAPEAAS